MGYRLGWATSGSPIGKSNDWLKLWKCFLELCPLECSAPLGDEDIDESQVSS